MINSISELVEKCRELENKRYTDFVEYADGFGIGRQLADICYDVMYGKTPRFAPLIDDKIPHRINYVVQPIIVHPKLNPII